MQSKNERTLLILKPDAVSRKIEDDIKDCFESNGLRITAQKRIALSKKEVADFYSVHSKMEFFDDLCAYMSSAPVIVLVAEGIDAVTKARNLIGDYDPLLAAPETIRGKFGISKMENTIHGSDSTKNAANEIAFFFRGIE